MRDLDPTDIDSLVSIKGMVIRTTSMIPDLRRAYFQCESCGEGVDVEVDRGRVEEPNACGGCGGRRTLARIDNRGTYMDKQLIKLQVRTIMNYIYNNTSPPPLLYGMCAVDTFFFNQKNHFFCS